MKQNIVATANVDVQKNIETGASAPVVIVPSTTEGVEVAQATKEVGMESNFGFMVSVLGPNKVSIVRALPGQEIPKGSSLMEASAFLKEFKGFRIYKTENDGEFLGIFFGDGLIEAEKNNWLRWLGLLAQESCKALWASVVELCKEFQNTLKAEGFLAALKNLWNKFLTWVKAKCQALWETLVSLWEKFVGLFRKEEKKEEVKA